MKIDFDGSYSEISRLIRSSNKAFALDRSKANFTDLLRTISPNKPQVPETSNLLEKLSETKHTPLPQEKGPMASYNFSKPEVYKPQPSSLRLLDEKATDVNSSDVGVKSPSILSVKRLKPQEDKLVNMPKEQRISKVGELMRDAGIEHGVDPLLGLAVVDTESSFNPNAVSSDGHASKGLFQLLDSTGLEIFKQTDFEDKYNPFNPQQNVEIGIRYLRRLHDFFSKDTELSNEMVTSAAANSSSLEKLAVAAFNAGEGRVASAQQRAARSGVDPSHYDGIAPYLPESTQQYVSKVMRIKGQFEADYVG